MTPTLYAHPFSSYCQKVLIALYENDTLFETRAMGRPDGAAEAELAALWPLKRFPVLVEDGRTILEASVIIEYLDLRHPGPTRLIPDSPQAALEARTMDRLFDNYVMTPMQKLVFDALRPEASRDAYGVAEAKKTLDTIYAWLDGTMAGRTWAIGDDFSIADCAAAPSLFYAHWAHPIGGGFVQLRGYLDRLLARPSFARAVDEARPYRAGFPIDLPPPD